MKEAEEGFCEFETTLSYQVENFVDKQARQAQHFGKLSQIRSSL